MTFRHGTQNGYGYHKCRCDECTIANRDNSREYSKKHAQRVREYNAEWRKNNREKYNERQNITAQKRRAEKYENGVFKVTPKDVKRIYSMPCTYCGSTDKITMDHVVPISRGGTHSIGNLVPACVSCNSSKGKKLIVEWMAVA